MKNKFKRVPFDVELAKDIQSGKIEGKIVTVNGDPIRVLAFDIKDKFPIVVAVTRSNGNEIVYTCESTGKYLDGYRNSFYDIVIELPEEAPKHILKKEKVLYKQYKNSSFLLDKILKAVGNDFDEKEKESFKIVKKYLDDIISIQSNRLDETPKARVQAV